MINSGRISFRISGPVDTTTAGGTAGYEENTPAPVEQPTYTQTTPLLSLTGTLSNLTDGNLSTGAAAIAVGGVAYIQADLGVPMPISSITLGVGTLPVLGSVLSLLSGSTLQYSGDGVSWSDIGAVNSLTTLVSGQSNTIKFPGVTAQYFRISSTTGSVATSTFILQEY